MASGRLADGQLLAERAVTHIRRLIASGELSPGDRVKEVEISNALGISRGPVRGGGEAALAAPAFWSPFRITVPASFC